MYLLYAPSDKFGSLPANHPLLTDDVRFTQNVAYCPTFYWHKTHIINGCKDITPKRLEQLRATRQLKLILVLAAGGLGDSMWAMPFCRNLKEKYPQSTILVVTEKKNEPAWRYVPYITATIENAVWNMFGLFHKADEIYDFGGVATMLKKYIKLDPIEATFRYARLALPKEKSKCRPHLIVTIDEGRQAQARLARNKIDTTSDTIISISLHSSTPNRTWPFEYTKDLTKRLLNDGMQVIWLGTDKKYSTEYLNNDTNDLGQLNLVGKTDIRNMLAIAALSNVCVGPNSSFMVIGAALNIPTVGLFGSHKPKYRTKFYERFTGLWEPCHCSPCNEHWTECREGHPSPCMKSILPGQVFLAIKYLLKKYPRSILEKLPIE
jgi:ADP-heptose:LPS heptosyltransferase